MNGYRNKHMNSEELLIYSEKPGKILYTEKCFSLPKYVGKKNLNFLNSVVFDDAKS